MNRKRYCTFLVGTLALLIMVISGCGGKKQPPPVTKTPPPQPKPVTATLSASPPSIERGQTTTLNWTTENADDVTLEGNKVDTNGSQSASPTQSTTYRLIAKGPGGTQEATARVTVSAPATTTPTTTTTTPLSDDQIFAQAVQDIYFEYDSAKLTSDSQQKLAQAAQALSQHPNWKVRIEGNCDERGSTEYNLTLGDERAGAARQALTQAGVTADRLQTISYGKEKPICTDANEDCWQKNRHDHFVLLH
ncbi:MAG TPA: peptidoglycan-associated lipoprotein Pal [Candidatus Angelobacter sp.]|nr:peptidoglycan-associated lipoprotein Pal [Candidatus Angelobacter sp.]